MMGRGCWRPRCRCFSVRITGRMTARCMGDICRSTELAVFDPKVASCRAHVQELELLDSCVDIEWQKLALSGEGVIR
jgi:hypothetical protein